MKALEDMSDKALKLHVADLDKAFRASIAAMERAGLGHATIGKIEELTKGSALVSKTAIAREYLSARAAYQAAHVEADKREDARRRARCTW